MGESSVKSSYSFIYSKFRHLFNKINVNVTFSRHTNFRVESSSLGRSKCEFSKEQLNSIFRYKFSKWAEEGCYLLATDASVVNNVVGLAFYDPQQKISEMFKLDGKYSSTFGELVAIRQAVSFLLKKNINRWVIVRDSLAAVRLIGKKASTNFIVASIHNMIAKSNCVSAMLVWVPSHVGIGINEKADHFARAAVSEGLPIEMDLTLGEAVCKIQSAIWTEWEVEFREISCTKGSFFAGNISDIKRRPWFTDKKCNFGVHDIKLVNRLMMGHTYGRTFLSKFLRGVNDLCDVCGIRETSDHLIFQCSKFSAARSTYTFFNNCNNLKDFFNNSNLYLFSELIHFLHKFFCFKL
ncbi:PREDICTED: uncharacterized protein LOC108355780 [Rhagoletis zephyria]|uniref:uncharacterized protein LOC108355780 n=1 Tax=Rhagoletis zephyria TaxID=28612 RepID=UPI0008118EE4|nr:PREDICTED: uncharacterized protein LOC108355780 [Rhagoletis zephyria]